jgi:tRNA-dihydrouridine synthase C
MMSQDGQQALTLTHPRSGKSVTFPVPLFLAPMEGVTDAVFRDEVIRLGGVGGAITEFIRISNSAMSSKVVRRYLGDARYPQTPVGVQFMAADVPFLAESIHAAERLQVPWIDLNFGCPVPVVFNKCAGSALLDHPEKLARITKAAVDAASVPVSIKIRVGVKDSSRLAEIIAAGVENGAAMITVHARLRCHAYSHPAHWPWLADAISARDKMSRRIPLIGNGGVDHAADINRMRQETGCDGVMIGRAALANPWIFAQWQEKNKIITAQQATDFAVNYTRAIEQKCGERAALAKLKQLLRYYQAGNVFQHNETLRTELLRHPVYEDVLAKIKAW